MKIKDGAELGHEFDGKYEKSFLRREQNIFLKYSWESLPKLSCQSALLLFVYDGSINEMPENFP